MPLHKLVHFNVKQSRAVFLSAEERRGERRVLPPPVVLTSLELRPTEASEFPSSVPSVRF